LCLHGKKRFGMWPKEVQTEKKVKNTVAHRAKPLLLKAPQELKSDYSADMWALGCVLYEMVGPVDP
jgi:serine/threonine protein kinase